MSDAELSHCEQFLISLMLTNELSSASPEKSFCRGIQRDGECKKRESHSARQRNQTTKKLFVRLIKLNRFLMEITDSIEVAIMVGPVKVKKSAA